MTANDLKDEIQVFASLYDLTYIRATELEANIQLDKIDITKRVLVHYDQTEIKTEVSQGQIVVKVIPTLILFLNIDSQCDDDLNTIDNYTELCEIDADKFYDYISQSGLISNLVPLGPYTLDRLPAFKRMDARLSGILFSCDIPITREDYYCIPEPE